MFYKTFLWYSELQRGSLTLIFPFLVLLHYLLYCQAAVPRRHSEGLWAQCQAVAPVVATLYLRTVRTPHTQVRRRGKQVRHEHDRVNLLYEDNNDNVSPYYFTHNEQRNTRDSSVYMSRGLLIISHICNHYPQLTQTCYGNAWIISFTPLAVTDHHKFSRKPSPNFPTSQTSVHPTSQCTIYAHEIIERKMVLHLQTVTWTLQAT